MDPVSHCLLGRTLGCLDGGRLGPGATAAFVVGSIAPDADGVLAWWGWDFYLRVHEVGTHTLVAAPVVGAVVAAGLTLVVRRARFLGLFVGATLGVAIGHIGFDLVSGSDIRTLAPFSATRVGWHLLTMADLLGVATVIAGTALAWWRRRLGASLTLALLASLLGVKAVSQQRGATIYERALTDRGERPQHQGRSEAVSGSLFEWSFFDRHGRDMRVWRVDARQGTADIRFTYDVPVESLLIGRTRHLPVVRNFLPLSDLPFPRVTREGDGYTVLWSDLRWCRLGDCDLSFGALFGPGLRPRLQVIQIGGYRQTRPIED